MANFLKIAANGTVVQHDVSSDGLILNKLTFSPELSTNDPAIDMQGRFISNLKEPAALFDAVPNVSLDKRAFLEPADFVINFNVDLASTALPSVIDGYTIATLPQIPRRFILINQTDPKENGFYEFFGSWSRYGYYTGDEITNARFCSVKTGSYYTGSIFANKTRGAGLALVNWIVDTNDFPMEIVHYGNQQSAKIIFSPIDSAVSDYKLVGAFNPGTQKYEEANYNSFNSADFLGFKGLSESGQDLNVPVCVSGEAFNGLSIGIGITLYVGPDGTPVTLTALTGAGTIHLMKVGIQISPNTILIDKVYFGVQTL
jgi:hypothetical protein